MKKLIHPWTLPFMFVFVMIYGITNSPDVYAAEDSIVVPAVIYNGETIPCVNLPAVEIIAERNSPAKADGKLYDKNKNVSSPNRYGPKQIYIKIVYNS